MKSEHHKMILSCYREGRDDPTQPEFAEALAALETDSELATWYAENCQFDTVFTGALSRCTVPPRAEILSEPRKSVLQFPRLLAAAAALAIVAGGLNLVMRSQSGTAVKTADAFRQEMAHFAASDQIRLDHMGGNFASLQEFMKAKGGLRGDALPEVFPKAMPKGCQLIQWQGSSVSLYCFTTDGMQIVHAFLLPTSEVSVKSLAQVSQLQVHSELQTGGWVEGDTLYMLVASSPTLDITRFLEPSRRNTAFLDLQEAGYILCSIRRDP